MVLVLIVSIPALNHKIPKKFPLALEFLPITWMKVKIAYNTFHTGTGFWEGIMSEKVSVCGTSRNSLDQARQVAPEPCSCRVVCVIHGKNFCLVVVKENCFNVPKKIKDNCCETNSHTFANSLLPLYCYMRVMVMKIWIYFSSSQLENWHGPVGCRNKTCKPDLAFRAFLPCSF